MRDHRLRSSGHLHEAGAKLRQRRKSSGQGDDARATTLDEPRIAGLVERRRSREGVGNGPGPGRVSTFSPRHGGADTDNDIQPAALDPCLVPQQPRRCRRDGDPWGSRGAAHHIEPVHHARSTAPLVARGTKQLRLLTLSADHLVSALDGRGRQHDAAAIDLALKGHGNVIGRRLRRASGKQARAHEPSPEESGSNESGGRENWEQPQPSTPHAAPQDHDTNDKRYFKPPSCPNGRHNSSAFSGCDRQIPSACHGSIDLRRAQSIQAGLRQKTKSGRQTQGEIIERNNVRDQSRTNHHFVDI